jgi:hypothetical protein
MHGKSDGRRKARGRSEADRCVLPRDECIDFRRAQVLRGPAASTPAHKDPRLEAGAAGGDPSRTPTSLSAVMAMRSATRVICPTRSRSSISKTWGWPARLRETLGVTNLPYTAAILTIHSLRAEFVGPAGQPCRRPAGARPPCWPPPLPPQPHCLGTQPPPASPARRRRAPPKAARGGGQRPAGSTELPPTTSAGKVHRPRAQRHGPARWPRKPPPDAAGSCRCPSRTSSPRCWTARAKNRQNYSEAASP